MANNVMLAILKIQNWNTWFQGFRIKFSRRIYLGNIYAPNKMKEQCNFFVELQQKLDDFITIQDQRIIIGGDFNVIMDQNLDCAGGSPKEKESVKFLNDICLNYDLIDIWRTRNPDSTLFTWRQKKPLIQRRLDFWLISDFCQDEVEETSIKTAIRTDHSAIIISSMNQGEALHIGNLTLA